PGLRPVRLLHPPGAGADRALEQSRQIREQGLRPAQAPRREGRPPAPRQARRQAHDAYGKTGGIPRAGKRRALQAGALPLLGLWRKFSFRYKRFPCPNGGSVLTWKSDWG